MRPLAALVLALMLTAIGCSDHLEIAYANASPPPGEFDRGWLPPILQPDVINICKLHDPDIA
jgi:hypothetical protein